MIFKEDTKSGISLWVSSENEKKKCQQLKAINKKFGGELKNKNLIPVYQ